MRGYVQGVTKKIYRCFFFVFVFLFVNLINSLFKINIHLSLLAPVKKAHERLVKQPLIIYGTNIVIQDTIIGIKTNFNGYVLYSIININKK